MQMDQSARSALAVALLYSPCRRVGTPFIDISRKGVSIQLSFVQLPRLALPTQLTQVSSLDPARAGPIHRSHRSRRGQRGPRLSRSRVALLT